MSELSKLLETRLPGANPANLANPTPEISRISNFSSVVVPIKHLAHDNNLQVLASSSVQSVDTLRRKLLRGRRGELRRAAGEDWDEFSVPAKIIGFADSLATEQIREDSSAPDHYSATTECRRCGPVPIFPGCPPQLNGCPWCRNRIHGLPIPKIKLLTEK